ncbi:MAG TPA: hypothetical protein VFH71_09945 [Rhodanobacteraceae bacterium]|nr:hypothetical protein [Rhodanobacteraceae bacterium]
MRLRWYALFGIFFLLCLLIDALSFGALSREPPVGQAILTGAEAEAPIARTYIALGTPLVSASPILQTVGESMADAAFGDSFSAIDARPAAAVDLLFSESHGPMSALFMLAYWGAPLLLVCTLLAWLMRTRQTHLIKSVRR